MSGRQAPQRVLIQIERPGPRLDMPAARALLADTGIALDEGYGPILVNPREGRYVVRGSGSARAVAKARRVPGVQVFADAAIRPASR
jgi:hypothetical protein